MARGIYKRGNVYWIRYAGLDGRIIRESSGSIKFRDAEALLIKRKQAIKEGKQPEIKRIANYTFSELAVKYSAWMEGRHRSANSKAYRIKDMVSRFGTLPLRRFNTQIVEQYQTNLMDKLSPASVNKNISILKAMFRKAVEWDMVEEETLKRIRNVKLLSVNNGRLRYLSKEECRALINACDPHLKPIVITALNTGMRKGEILSLKWDNIDLKHGFILLDRTKNGERREIPINDTLRNTLIGLPSQFLGGYVFGDIVTVKEDGKEGLKVCRPYKDIKRSFKTALRRAGIKDFHFHDLRHTFASHLVMAGVDITTVSKLLGHKRLTMTLRYSHLAPSHMSNAVNVLDGVLTDKPTAQKLTQSGSVERCSVYISA